MPDPMISVVMPIYNAGAFLPTAIESIINQTYKDFELLLINDCSTDGSLEVMQRYAAANPALRVIQTERNLGLIGSLNVGFAAARGAYIARMDQDDIALPARFEKQVAFLEANPDVAIVGSHVQVISDSGRFGEVWRYPTTREGVQKGVAEKVCFAHPGGDDPSQHFQRCSPDASLPPGLQELRRTWISGNASAAAMPAPISTRCCCITGSTAPT
jgi:glycosyltransferase involved in cell wall biosynthesis